MCIVYVLHISQILKSHYHLGYTFCKSECFKIVKKQLYVQNAKIHEDQFDLI